MIPSVQRFYESRLEPRFRSEGHTEFFNRFAADFDEPCLETAIAYIVFRRPLDWRLADAEALYAQYCKQRHHRDGIHLNPFVGGAHLGNRRVGRRCWQPGSGNRLRRTCSRNNPGDAQLVALEADLMTGSRTSFTWQEIWLPAEPEDNT